MYVYMCTYIHTYLHYVCVCITIYMYHPSFNVTTHLGLLHRCTVLFH